MTLFIAEFLVYSGNLNSQFSVLFVYSEPMSAKDPEGITIPSVFVGEEAGLILKVNYQYKSNCFVVIKNELLIKNELPFNINVHLLLPFAIVVGICFFILLVFVVSIQSEFK